MATKAHLMDSLRYEIAVHLCAIEDLCQDYGLTTITRFTCIARDPANVHMTVLISNDDLAEACHVAQTYTKEIADGT